MKVAFYQTKLCIRASKMIRALRSSPEISRIIVISMNKTAAHNPQVITGKYNIHYVARNVYDLRKVIEKESPDILHCHNYPDSPTVIGLNSVVGTKTKVIHDNHDLGSLGNWYREPPERGKANELSANTKSNGRIFVSNTMEEYINKRYGTGNDLIFPSYAMASIVPSKMRKHNGYIVYQGGLRVGEQRRNCKRLFSKIAYSGTKVHCYPSNSIRYKIASKNYVQKNTTPSMILYKILPSYIAGLNLLDRGYELNTDYLHTDMVMPNKLFEYLACGIPVISTEGTDINKFIKDHKCGFIVNQDMTNIREAVSHSVRIRSNIFRRRNEYTMEGNINKLISFYKKIMEG